MNLKISIVDLENEWKDNEDDQKIVIKVNSDFQKI